ncbi:MAG: ECF transporter S component [Clostridia bacterium]|nr:ECF transporter S component [Clostridia bacterium]
MEQKKEKSLVRTIVWFAILLALVIVLQVFASSIPLGMVKISLTLVPIVLGGMILGPFYGGMLGLVFGVITLIAGITGADPFTAIIFNDHPVITSLICIVKATAAGVGSAFIYKAIYKKKKYLATFIAAGAAPIINTGLFILGALTMSDTIGANFLEDGQTVIYFLVVVCAGVNFLVEFAVNMLLSPAIYRVSEIVEKRKY